MGKRTKLNDEMKRQIGTSCANCGATDELQYHHVVPLAMGGNDIPSNMICLCARCHSFVHYGRDGVIAHNFAVREGIRKAKSAGVRWGKAPADGEKIMKAIAEHSTQFLGGDWTEDEIMEFCGVKSVCYHKYKRQLISDLQSGAWDHSFSRPEMIRSVPLYRHVVLRSR